MPEAQKFRDEQTVHLFMDESGNTYICDEDFPSKPQTGTMVIQRIDPKTNTIWFAPSYPNGCPILEETNG